MSDKFVKLVEEILLEAKKKSQKNRGKGVKKAASQKDSQTETHQSKKATARAASAKDINKSNEELKDLALISAKTQVKNELAAKKGKKYEDLNDSQSKQILNAIKKGGPKYKRLMDVAEEKFKKKKKKQADAQKEASEFKSKKKKD